MELIDGKEKAQKWVQGLPLVMVTAGITLVVFLMLLDTAILATVGVTFCPSYFFFSETIAYDHKTMSKIAKSFLGPI
jgi:hypothetical protein